MKLFSQVFGSSRKVGGQAIERFSAASSFFTRTDSFRARPARWLRLTVFAVAGASSLLHAKIPAGDPVLTQDENLLPNADFTLREGSADRPLRWTLASTTTTVNQLDALITTAQRIESTDPADAVNASLKVVDTLNTNEVVVRSERRLAIPGMTYDAQARVYDQTGTAATLYLEFWDEDDTVPTATASGALTAAPDGKTLWKVASVSAAAPSNAMHVSVSIRSGVSATGTSFWDKVTLRPQLTYDKTLALGAHEFFIDDYRLESSFDVQRVVQKPVKIGPVLEKDKNWESPTLLLVYSVLQEAANSYKMWYYSNGRMLYATSTDGIAWTKPIVGNYTYGAGTNNNIAFDPTEGRMTLVRVPVGGGSYEYRALRHAGPTSGYHYFKSTTGIGGWAIQNAGAEVLPYANVSSLAYDSVAGKYIATTRQPTSDVPTGLSSLGERAVFISTSTDMITWTSPNYASAQFSPALEGDRADDFAAQSRRHIDIRGESMPVFPYGTVYLGFPSMFELSDFTTGAAAGTTGNGATYPQLASSRDLRVWHRPDRSPMIPLGGPGAWDAGGIIGVASAMVEGTDALGKKWLYVYYTGNNLGRGGDFDGKTVKSSIGLAKWEPERFVAISNRARRINWKDWDTGVTTATLMGNEGFVTTKTITCPTNATKLKINALVGPADSVSTLSRIRVEILNASTNAPISGFEFSNATSVAAGDWTDKQVAWTGNPNLGALAGQDIKLKFYVLNADLYSFWFEQ